MGGIKAEAAFDPAITWNYQLLGRKDAEAAMKAPLDENDADSVGVHTFEHVFSKHAEFIEEHIFNPKMRRPNQNKYTNKKEDSFLN